MVYKCPFCGREVRLLGAFIRHVKIHVKDMLADCRCPFCDVSFRSIDALRNHCWEVGDYDHLVLYIVLTPRNGRSSTIANPRRRRKKVRHLLKEVMR